MSNRSADALFQLIQSLDKAEKRSFKLYLKRNGSGSAEWKMVRLFDVMDKMEVYDEAQLPSRVPGLSKQQLSNTKAYLYKQILVCIRLLRSEEFSDLSLHEQLAYARILYRKGLFLQSLRILDKAKEQALQLHQYAIALEILDFEKNIEALHITRSFGDRASRLETESEDVLRRLNITNCLSNLSLRLYSWYIHTGLAREENDVRRVTEFMENGLDDDLRNAAGFYEQLYLYQVYCWRAFICQDFLQYYRCARRWVLIFDKQPEMLHIEIMHYIKGVHNLLNAHFMLRNYWPYRADFNRLEALEKMLPQLNNRNAEVQVFTYLSLARLNLHFLEGTFDAGIGLVSGLEEQLGAYSRYMDPHRVLVFDYKIACLYFGVGDYNKTIGYLNRIIQGKADLRTDIQCYARLLHLISHYELGHSGLVDHLIRSVYRFMARMQNLNAVEEEIFRFLRQSFYLQRAELPVAFQALQAQLKSFEQNPLAARSFIYLDFISWLDSKILHAPVQDVIHGKFLERQSQRRKTVR